MAGSGEVSPETISFGPAIVARERVADQASTAQYDKHYPKQGVYVCRGCQTPLYTAKDVSIPTHLYIDCNVSDLFSICAHRNSTRAADGQLSTTASRAQSRDTLTSLLAWSALRLSARHAEVRRLCLLSSLAFSAMSSTRGAELTRHCRPPWTCLQGRKVHAYK